MKIKLIVQLYLLVIFIQYTGKNSNITNNNIPYWGIFFLNLSFFYLKSFVFLNFQYLKTPCIFVELLVHVYVDSTNYPVCLVLGDKNTTIYDTITVILKLYSLFLLFTDVSVMRKSDQAANIATIDLKIRHMADFFVEQIPNGRRNSRNISHKIKVVFFILINCRITLKQIRIFKKSNFFVFDSFSIY